MTRSAAITTLEGLGIKPAELATHQGIKKFRKRYAVAHHPDRGGDTPAFRRMNGAVQFLLDAPEVGIEQTGVSQVENLTDLVSRARDLGFFRVQIRDYVPYLPMFWESAGYFGRVARTKTVRRTGKTARSDQEVAEGLLRYIAHTSELVGRPVEDPSKLIFKITVVEPIGENPGHAAVAWKTSQDQLAREFGHFDRWHSFTMSMTPGDEKKWKRRRIVDTGGVAAAEERQARKEKWTRDKVARAMREGGLIWISGGDRQERWAPYGTPKREVKRTDHLILTGRTIKRSDAYYGHHQFYFGELTTPKVDGLIRWAGGTVKPTGQRMFAHPASIPIHKAKAVANIINTNGTGTHENWEIMDVWLTAKGLRSVLGDLEQIYKYNRADWTTGEENWWISQLTS